MIAPDTARAHVSRPEHWPFETAAERQSYDAERAQAFALLKGSHERFLAAVYREKGWKLP